MNKQIEALLGTKKASEQAERVEHLLKMAAAPVVDLVIRYDPRADMIGLNVIGGELPVADILKILHAAEDMLRQKELEAAKLSTPKEE